MSENAVRGCVAHTRRARRDCIGCGLLLGTRWWSGLRETGGCTVDQALRDVCRRFCIDGMHDDACIALHDLAAMVRLTAEDGCACHPHDQDAGGGYVEHLLEYEPACPVHSEHVYDPRQGMWIRRDDTAEAALASAKAEALREAADRPGPYPTTTWKFWLRGLADEIEASADRIARTDEGGNA